MNWYLYDRELWNERAEGPYIQNVGGGVGGGGGWRVFVEVMKYFRHILMGHKIFFKMFDGSQNISLCSIFVILFSKLTGRITKYPY